MSLARKLARSTRRSPVNAPALGPVGPPIVLAERHDRARADRYGAQVGESPSFAACFAATRARLDALLRARIAAGEWTIDVSWGWVWALARSRARALRELVVIGEADASEHERIAVGLRGRRGLVVTGAAEAEVVSGIDRDDVRVVRVNAHDLDRNIIAVDRVAIVHADGSLGPLVPSFGGEL